MERSSPAPLRAPKFAAASAFTAELEAAVRDYFDRRGLSMNANGAMVRKTVAIFAWTIGWWAVAVWPGVPGAVRLLAAAGVGFGFAGMGMSIGHDALHGAYSRRGWVNRMLGMSFELMGVSGYIWRFTHNIAHHTYTNIDDLDPDVDFEPAIRVVSSRPRRWFQRWQWIYAFPIYGISGLRWVLWKDFADFRRQRLGPYVSLRHPWWAWASLFVSRGVAFTLTIFIPVAIGTVSWAEALIGFTVAYLMAGVTMALVFLLAHIVEGPSMLPPVTGRVGDSFFEHQVRTTADFACDNRFLAWYLGGLNFQVEHHLFPHICSVHYPAIRPLVREISQRHGLPVYEFPTMRAALASHVALLRRMGAPEVARGRIAQAA